MVDVKDVEFVHCGATVICKNFVVTAWHCFRPEDENNPGHVKALGEQDFNILVGANDIKKSKGPTQLEPGMFKIFRITICFSHSISHVIIVASKLVQN